MVKEPVFKTDADIEAIERNFAGIDFFDALMEGRRGKSGRYNSVGVQNVQERIRMMYGEQYGIRYSSVKGEFTRVTVLLPLEYVQTAEVEENV